MGIQIIGAGGSVAEVGAFAAKGIHVASKPIDYGTLGHYRVQVMTGVLAAALAANSQLLQFKWTDASRFAVILRVFSGFNTLTRFTAGTITDFGLDMFVVRGYTGGGGGTTLTLTGDNQALRTSMGSSLATINVATTGALTAVSATLDIQPIGQTLGGHGDQVVPSATLSAWQNTAPLNGQFNAVLFEPAVRNGEHPLVLAQNEGFLVRNRTVWPVAGTGQYSFGCVWAEVTAY